MVKLTRFDGSLIVLNAELIETVEATPDTVVTMTTGHKFTVLESVDDLLGKVVGYRRDCSARPLRDQKPLETPDLEGAEFIPCDSS